MNKLLLVLLAVFFSTLRGSAQQYVGGSGEGYGGLYYSPVIYGPSGFRTVEEEDALTNKAIEEIRRKRHEDSMGAEGLAERRKAHIEGREVRYIRSNLNTPATEEPKPAAQPAPAPREEPRPSAQAAPAKPVSRFSLQSFFH